MTTIEQLNAKHSSYDAIEAGDLWSLYVGGKEIEKRYSKFLPISHREPPAIYRARLAHAEYRPYLGAVIKYFSDALFTSKPSAEALANGEPVVDLNKYWAELKEDCTGSGLDLDGFFKQRMIEAMVKGKFWVVVSQPDDGLGQAQSLLEHEQRGLGDCYLRNLDYDSVYDWEVDEKNNLEWVICHDSKTIRKNIDSKRDWVIETWTRYSKETIDTYRIEYNLSNPPSPETGVPLISSVDHSFGVCPIVCVELPEGYHTAAYLKSSQLSNFRAVSNQNWSIAATCYAQPIVKVNDAEEYAGMMMMPGHGIIIKPDEDFSWDAPPRDHFRAADTQIVATKDEIYRLSFQMANGVENNVAAVGRTAESKIADAQSTRIALTSYGRIVKEAIERVYDIISSVRGETYKWNIAGLDDFAGIDTAALLAMGLSLKELGGIHSVTWNTKFEQKLAEALMPDNDETTKAKTKQEISEYLASAPTEQQQELNLFAAQHAIVAGDSAKAGALVAPQSKANATQNRGGTKPFSAPKPKAPQTGGTHSTSGFVKAKKPGGK